MPETNRTKTTRDTFTGFHDTAGIPIPGSPPAPCPFCSSGTPGTDNLLDVTGHRTGAYSVTCQNCGAEGPSGMSSAEAIANWNRHAEGPPINPLVDGVPGDTFERIAALETWKSWHPEDPDAGEPSEEVAAELAMAEAILRDLVRDAARYEARRSSVK